ncbi:MAG: hypothetical protein ACREIN_02110 [Candidatus Methylomirabilaceae bacterium]
MAKKKPRKKEGCPTQRTQRALTQRPARRGPRLPPLDALVGSVLRGGRELLEREDPFQAEGWASQMLGLWFKVPIPPLDRFEFEKQIRIQAVEAAEGAGTPEALAVLRAFAAMSPDPIAPIAWGAAERLAARGVPDPLWSKEIGNAEFLGAWKLSDPYGDQDGYYFSFRYPSREPHLLMALVDNNIGGIVRDASFGTPLEDIRETAAAIEGAQVVDAEAGPSAAAVGRAVEIGDQYLDNDWTDDFRKTRALLLARMHSLKPSPLDPGDPLAHEEREKIVKEFVASSGLPDHDVAMGIASSCVDYACDYTPDRDPFRWSPIVVECFLLGWLPRKVMLDTGEIRAMPAVMKAWIEFALTRRGLPARLIEETKASIDPLIREFRSLATDHSSFGPAKALVAAMMADGIDMTNQSAVDGWITEFNTRPVEERDELLGM